MNEYMVLIRSHGVYVKSLNFFREQGGHEQEWGLNWIKVEAGSIEGARDIGKVMQGDRRMKSFTLHYDKVFKTGRMAGVTIPIKITYPVSSYKERMDEANAAADTEKEFTEIPNGAKFIITNVRSDLNG